jgi:predicted secreted protein
MYKTISITSDTFQNLHAIATRLDKPKSQIVDDLVKGYIEEMKEKEKKELQAHNNFVAGLAARVTLPEGAIINSEDLDKELANLKDQEF